MSSLSKVECENFPHSTFDNDDMKSSKRQVTFLSLIFLLKCFKILSSLTKLRQNELQQIRNEPNEIHNATSQEE